MITSTFQFKLLKRGQFFCEFLSYELFNMMIKSLWSYLLFVLFENWCNLGIELFNLAFYWVIAPVSCGEELRETRGRLHQTSRSAEC